MTVHQIESHFDRLIKSGTLNSHYELVEVRLHHSEVTHCIAAPSSDLARPLLVTIYWDGLGRCFNAEDDTRLKEYDYKEVAP